MVAVKVAVVSALCLGGTVYAAPATVPAEVDYLSILIPGEGLPTPQELGLTNEDLTKPIPSDFLPSNGISERDNVLRKRTQCSPDHTCALSDSTACFNYLLSLNETPCEAGKINRQMCNVNGCRWIGLAENTDWARSYCRDVAYGGNSVNIELK
ncbi:hypothetical protein Dda_3429 [Drechslerella dactyloides]|uniref:Uncharacterized protein n=1 Tax=Drechslerella dactyloides TaxID=74499 RepID=A0AAD6J5T7_DREDA|nr:hypothetical protein Dda_3429 [Drechslerella dactyloides]